MWLAIPFDKLNRRLNSEQGLIQLASVNGEHSNAKLGGALILGI
jgi:hypothetical protein